MTAYIQGRGRSDKAVRQRPQGVESPVGYKGKGDSDGKGKSRSFVATTVLLKCRGAAMSLSRRRAAAFIKVSRGRSRSRPVDNDDIRTLSETKACANNRVVSRMTA